MEEETPQAEAAPPAEAVPVQEAPIAAPAAVEEAPAPVVDDGVVRLDAELVRRGFPYF